LREFAGAAHIDTRRAEMHHNFNRPAQGFDYFNGNIR
jgi:hypothetical protein